MDSSPAKRKLKIQKTIIICGIGLIVGVICGLIPYFVEEAEFQKDWRFDIREDTSEESIYELVEQGDVRGLLEKLETDPTLENALTSPSVLVQLAAVAARNKNHLTGLLIREIAESTSQKDTRSSALASRFRNEIAGWNERAKQVTDRLRRGDKIAMEDVFLLEQWLESDELQFTGLSFDDVKKMFGRKFKRTEREDDKDDETFSISCVLHKYVRVGGGSRIEYRYTKTHELALRFSNETRRLANWDILRRRTVKTDYSPGF